MKIAAIRPIAATIGIRTQLLVKVETDAGLHGWGESGLSGRERAVEGALHHLADLLIGRDPMNVSALWQELYRSQYYEGGRVLQAAISAIDIALHDLKGKALGVPVHQLLGGRHRDRVPTFATTTAPPGPAMIDQARRLCDHGWTCIRLLASGHDAAAIYEPREHLGATARWAVRAREALGDAVALGVEFHHRLSPAEAASFCQKLPPGTLDFLEEPIRAESPEAYEALRRLTGIPFAIGEEFASKWQFLPFIERGILQFNRLDVCNVGGLTEAMKIAGWSEAHYIDLMPHNPLGPVCTAASVHLAAAVPNLAWLETRATPVEALGFDPPEIFPLQVARCGADLIVPTGPGLGVEVDEAQLSAAGFRPWQPPVLRRRDGSLTNW